MIETERLRIIPLSVKQFFVLLAGIDKMERALELAPSGEVMDDETLEAMDELYRQSLLHPDDYLWYTNWQIILKDENKSIGSACFMREGYADTEAEIGYGIHNQYRNHGYMSEAVHAMATWAFANGVERLLAETDKGNLASQKVLQHIGMEKFAETDDTIRWQLHAIFIKSPKKSNSIMNIISVREQPEQKDRFITYFQTRWPQVYPVIYQDSITHCLTAENPLPQWYLLEKDGEILGGAGLITNDFISRMDLYPWICAVYIEEKHRGNEYSSLLIERAKTDAARAGFPNVYLCTDHIGFYEKYGFEYIGQGYHPWEEESRMYQISVRDILKKPVFSIRSETPEDYPVVYELIRKAFKTANVKDGDEQDYAVGLRESAKYIPQLSLVAECDGKLIGHIMFTHFPVIRPDGSHFDALLVAPVSVLLGYRSKGVGKALMEEGFHIATTMGYKAAFLVGDPNYYSRFGYHTTSDYGIQNINDIPSHFVMVRELQPDALKGVTGEIDFH